MRGSLEIFSCPDEGEEMTGSNPEELQNKTLDIRAFRDDEGVT
jgi:hypothetical protein